MATVARSWEHDVVSTRVEELCCHVHLLLLSNVGVWGLALIHQVE